MIAYAMKRLTDTNTIPVTTNVMFTVSSIIPQLEAMGVNLGLYMGGRKPLLLIQNSGFYASVNTLRGLALDARVPTCLLIGEYFRKPQVPSQENPGRLVSMLEPTLELWGVPVYRLEQERDIAVITAAVEHAWRDRTAVAMLVGAPTAEVGG